jgi:hypothetical protein
MRRAGLVPREHFALPFHVMAVLARAEGKGALLGVVGKGIGSRDVEGEAVGVVEVRRRPARQEAGGTKRRHFALGVGGGGF